MVMIPLVVGIFLFTSLLRFLEGRWIFYNFYAVSAFAKNGLRWLWSPIPDLSGRAVYDKYNENFC